MNYFFLPSINPSIDSQILEDIFLLSFMTKKRKKEILSYLRSWKNWTFVRLYNILLEDFSDLQQID